MTQGNESDDPASTGAAAHAGRSAIPADDTPAPTIARLVLDASTIRDGLDRLVRQASLLAHYSTAPNLNELISRLDGADQISEALAASVDASREELLTAQPSGRRPPELLDEALARDVPMLNRGVVQRTVYPHTARVDAGVLAYARQVIASGAQIRTTAEVVERMIIVDRAVAYIPVGPERGRAALEIREPALIRFLVRVFDYMWDSGTPMVSELFTNRGDDVISEIDYRILRKLVAGCTDRAIAKALDIHERTVWEHVHRMSKRLGASGRAQLCYIVGHERLLEGVPDQA